MSTQTRWWERAVVVLILAVAVWLVLNDGVVLAIPVALVAVLFAVTVHLQHTNEQLRTAHTAEVWGRRRAEAEATRQERLADAAAIELAAVQRIARRRAQEPTAAELAVVEQLDRDLRSTPWGGGVL